MNEEFKTDKLIETNKKECPHCKSPDVQCQGVSSVCGNVRARQTVNKHHYKCSKCGKSFRYVGNNP